MTVYSGTVKVVLGAVVIFGAYTFFERREDQTAEKVVRAVEPQVEEAARAARVSEAQIDSLTVLLTDTSLMPAGSLNQTGQVIERIDDNATRESGYERRMEARMIRLLCWASSNCDVDCPQRRTQCGMR